MRRSFSASYRRGVKGSFGAEARKLDAILLPVPALIGLGLSGCALLSAPEFQANVQEKVFGRSTEGRPITGAVIGEGNETYLLFGVIHGNEPLGGPILRRFIRHVSLRPEVIDGKRLVVVPVANPDGLARGKRANARDVDLNRNFPARSWVGRAGHGNRPASEDETRVLLEVVRQFRPARILSLHSPLRCVNYDGPARAIASDIATATGYPLRRSIGYPTPGSFGSYAGDDLRIPTITLETGRESSAEDTWPLLRDGLLAFIDASPELELASD
jgi:protein MpaA